LMVASIVLVLLLSFAVLFQNQLPLLLPQQSSSSSSPSPSPIPSLVYADKTKVKNKSLINDISDQLVNLGSSKDELQTILQQIQTQIALTAGQDKATNVIKQIKSVIELNPNGHLSESLLFLAKQQAAGNIEDVNKVTTEVATYAANGTDNIVVVLEQAVAALQQQQQQQQLPSQSTTTTTTTESSPSLSSSPPPNNVIQQQQSQQQLQQSQSLQPSADLQQSVQPQIVISSSASSPSSSDSSSPEPQAQQSSPPPPPLLYSNNMTNDNNMTNANTVVSNSSPHSTIEVTSIDRPTEHRTPVLASSTPTVVQQKDQLTEQQQMIQQRIKEVINQSNPYSRNDATSLPKFIQKY
jgi:hypothetical protein